MLKLHRDQIEMRLIGAPENSRRTDSRIKFAMIKLVILICLAAFGALIVGGQTVPFAPEPDEPDLFPIYERGKIGYVDRAGKTVIEPQFDFGKNPFRGHFLERDFFHVGLAAASICKGEKQSCKTGFIDYSGKFVIAPIYDDVRAFTYSGLAAIKTGGLWGFIDKQGKTVIAPQFVEAESFQIDFAAIVRLRSGKRGVINRSGVVLKMPPGVQEFCAPSEERIAVKIRGKWGFINTKGKVIVAPRYEPELNDYGEDDYCGQYSSSFAAVKLNGKWGYVNWEGKLAIPAKFHRVEPFQDIDVAIAAEAMSRWGVINRTRDFVHRRRFEDMQDFSEGLAAVRLDGKWGFVDREGKLVIPATFEQVSFFSDKLAAVRVGGKWGYIDHWGKIVIEPQFISESYFQKGLARQVIKEAKDSESAPQWGYIDRAGKFVWKS